MIPKVNTFTLYLCCGTCYHKSIRFRSYFEARFALFSYCLDKFDAWYN